jgi:biotin carboxyl carrier protein
MKNLRVTVDGKIFNVTVEMLDEPSVAPAPARPAPVATPGAEIPRVAPPPAVTTVRSGGKGGEVLSPLSGKIISIDVKVGQDVDEGAQVATIEAMKMNTYVFAPKSGKVTAIIATAGTAIDEGLPLLEIG